MQLFTRTALTAMVLLGLTALFAAGCSLKKPAEQASTTQTVDKDPIHSIAAKDKKKLLADLEKDIAVLSEMREDTSVLTKAFTSKALAGLVEANASDRAAGRIKVYVFEDSELYVSSFAAKKLVAVTWTYIDNSHYIDKETGDRITEPTGAPRKFALAVVKENKRWKIGQLMAPAVAPPAGEGAETTGSPARTDTGSQGH